MIFPNVDFDFVVAHVIDPPVWVSVGGFVASVVQFRAGAVLMTGRAITPLTIFAVPVQPERVALSVMFDLPDAGALGTGGVHVTVPPNFVHDKPAVAEPAGVLMITPTGSIAAAASRAPPTFPMLRMMNAPPLLTRCCSFPARPHRAEGPDAALGPIEILVTRPGAREGPIRRSRPHHRRPAHAPHVARTQLAALHEYPEIQTITLDPSKTDERLAVYRRGNFLWNIDGATSDLPQKGTRGDLDEPRRKIQHLEDRTAILDCIARHARGCDRHDVELLASTFHVDGVDEHGVNDSADTRRKDQSTAATGGPGRYRSYRLPTRATLADRSTQPSAALV